MEVVGAIASSLQIVGQCASITMTIIKWVESVKTVDERINSFVHEVTTLRMTYESLKLSLEQPSMLEAARVTNRDVGGHLWGQLARTLKDCHRTVDRITNVLRKIDTNSSLFKSVLTQLKEQLNTGELARLREEIVMYNSSLQLPMQMITVTMQLEQYKMTTAHQVQLDDQLIDLRRSIERVERISRGLRTHASQRTTSSSASTLVGDSNADKTWFNNMEQFVGTAKRYLDSATTVATTLTTPSINQRADDSPLAIEARRGSAFTPLTQQKIATIGTFVTDLPLERGMDTPLESDVQYMAIQDEDEDESEEEEDDDTYFVVLQALLRNGHNAAEEHDYAVAEDNYRSALSVSQNNSFSREVACSSADITLLLGGCLAKQEKYDEAVVLLQPLASRPSKSIDKNQTAAARNKDRDIEKQQTLSANHFLGEVFLRKSDLVNAEKHALQAFTGRKKSLGKHNEKTLDSVKLVIYMNEKKGHNAMEDRFKEFLVAPSSTVHDIRQLSPSLSNTSSPLPAEPITPPMSVPIQRDRRPTFNLRPWKRQPETPPTSIPLSHARTMSGNSPYLVTADLNQLSTSPGDTSSLHIGSDAMRRVSYDRKQSSISNDSFTNIPRWSHAAPTIAEQPNMPLPHPRKLSRVPTIYGGLSQIEMESLFGEVSALSGGGKGKDAASRGLQILRKYDPEFIILNHREAELKKNIKESKVKGLAGTGHGYAPIHFFCSLKFEALTEVEILLKTGADPQAIACKAGYPNHDPFTPLSAAVSQGHSNVVKLLLEHGATWRPEMLKLGYKFIANPTSSHPLLQACGTGRAKIVEYLLRYGMGVDEEIFGKTGWHGNSLLHQASHACDLAMIETLMSFSPQKRSYYSFIGHAGQQDDFGMTPIMYAVDMRDDNSQRARTNKLQNRVACLKALLRGSSDAERVEDVEYGHEDEVLVDRPRQASVGRLATDLHLQDKKGNTIFWYAEESRGGDAQLRAFLDEQVRSSHLIEF